MKSIKSSRREARKKGKLQMKKIDNKKLLAALKVVLDEYGDDHCLRLKYFRDESFHGDPGEGPRLANRLERSFRYLERWEWLLAREMEKA
jgi:hypothetical protein